MIGAKTITDLLAQINSDKYKKSVIISDIKSVRVYTSVYLFKSVRVYITIF